MGNTNIFRHAKSLNKLIFIDFKKYIYSEMIPTFFFFFDFLLRGGTNQIELIFSPSFHEWFYLSIYCEIIYVNFMY